MTGESEALKQWNARRRRIFYPKTDLDFDLEARRRKKRELANADLRELSEIIHEKIESIEFLPNAGTFHALFRVKAQKQNHFLKLSTEPADFGFQIEACAMDVLSELGVPFPEADAYSVFPIGFMKQPFFVMEEAKGRPLNQFEDPETQAMPQPLLYEFGRMLGRIHTVNGKGAGLIDPSHSGPCGLHDNWQDYILLRLDAHLETCERIGAIVTERNEIEKLFVEASPLFHRAPIRWLHGDPGHHNAFSDGEKITAIIDWEDSICGDPIFDVAYWGTFARDEMRAEFLRGYQTIQTLPEDFERRYWLYYLRVAISKTVHRHLFGAKDRPGRPPASQRIQKALSKLKEL